MNEVKNSIVSSITKHINELKYFAKDNKKAASDIMLLIIVDEIYDWAAYNNALQSEQLKIQKLRKQIIRNNTSLVEPIFKTNIYYKNVNTPQTLYTWQRVYDAISVEEAELVVDNVLLINGSDILCDEYGNPINLGI